jgi:hypothetical protein
VTKVHAEEIRKNTVEWRDLSKQRGKIEMDVKPAVVNIKQPNVVQSVKVALPKSTIVHPEVKKVAPPHPELPKAVPHPLEKREKAEKKASLDRRGIMDWLCLESPYVTCSPLGTIGRERSRVPVA